MNKKCNTRTNLSLQCYHKFQVARTHFCHQDVTIIRNGATAVTSQECVNVNVTKKLEKFKNQAENNTTDLAKNNCSY